MRTHPRHDTLAPATGRHGGACRWVPNSLRIAAAAALVISTGCAARTVRVEPTKSTVAGITNFTRVDANTGLGGTTAPEAVAELKRMGFATIINFRRADEEGAEVEREASAAEDAGLRYVHIPFGFDTPDPDAQVARFLEEVSRSANQPVYIHCHSANRAGAFWMIKRVIQDGWGSEEALAEAEVIGLTNERLRAFAQEYVSTHRN